MKTLRKIIVIEMIALATLFMLPVAISGTQDVGAGNILCVFASSDNGADAHSNSMSVRSGDEDVNKAKSDSSKDSQKTDSKPADYDASQVTDEAGYTAEDEVKTGDDAAEELNVKDQVGKKDISGEGKKTSTIWIVVTIAVAICALAAAVLLFRSRGKDKDKTKNDKKYISKH